MDLGLGAHTFVGANGQGKTNLVEAVGYLATLGSHRVSTDQALVREGAEAAIVRARVRHEEREILMELQINRGSANRAQLNRSPSRPRDLSRSFASVLFAPEDLALVRGDPGVRRRFLDDLLVQRAPRLAGVISDYERTLKQRNTLLKSARARGLKADKLGTLDVWDEKLVTLGSEIIFERLQLVDLLREPVRDSYRAVAGSDHAPEVLLELSVGSSEDSRIPARDQDRARGVDIPVLREAFASALLRVRDRELERGVTLVGPHRDDLFFGLNALPARGYASHGESWSFALALKLASAELLRRDSATGDPVLVLDDVFAELDRERRRRLAVAVEGYEQVLITAAVFEDVPEELAHHLVHIQAGAIVDG